MGGVECAAPVEVRAAGRTLTGPAVTYDEVAGDRHERFSPGAFSTRKSSVPLVMQHDTDMVIATTEDRLHLEDTQTKLELRAELLPGSAALDLVSRRVLGGLSVGFVALEERVDAGVRVIDKAHLDHIGLVDRPSYRNSRVELRQMEDTWLRATIPYGRRLQCECAGPECTTVEFLPGSLDLGERDGDVLAVGGNYLNVLGSLRRGTLLVEDSPEGLRVGLTSSSTDTARKIMEAGSVSDIYVRPLLDLDDSDFTESDRVRTFSSASVRALIVKPTTASEGHIPADIDGVIEERALWL